MCWVGVEGFVQGRVRVESGVIEVEGRTWYCSGDGECVNVKHNASPIRVIMSLFGLRDIKLIFQFA